MLSKDLTLSYQNNLNEMEMLSPTSLTSAGQTFDSDKYKIMTKRQPIDFSYLH